MNSPDFVVIGGGIFGVYAALQLSRRGRRGILIEKESSLFSKASLVNQARLHGGYHYPRSVATAQMSYDHQARFMREHQECINAVFEKYYAIDRFGSLTDRLQFQRFCDYIGAPYEEVKVAYPFSGDRIAALFRTSEYSFDPLLIRQYYTAQIRREPGVEILMQTTIQAAGKVGNLWELVIKTTDQSTRRYQTPLVINATYAASNAIHQLFGLANIDLQHEIAEIVLLSVPDLKNTGLTVMDGQYGSLMPYGRTGLHSLSSVAYTHHQLSKDRLPTFSCQARNATCQPHLTANCNYCAARPVSNFRKMERQIRQYLGAAVQLNYYQSLFTIKAKLRANAIDDGRPTDIRQLANQPDFYCVFAGKVQSIYEIEKMVEQY